ncbi:MAG: hypothetical protein AAF645_29490, partial [Myxococcota bacterium]
DADEEAALRALVHAVRRDAPDLPEVRGAEAVVLARQGEHRAAMEAFVAAAVVSAGSEAAAWRRRAAELALTLDGPEAAEGLLEQALSDSKDDPSILVDLARVVRQRGDQSRASELLARLLRGPVDSATHEDALVAAARLHVEMGEDDRATPFLARLGPAFAQGMLEPADGRDDTPPVHPAELLAESGEHLAFHDERLPSQVFERPSEPPPPAAFQEVDLAPSTPAVTRVGTAADTLRSLIEAVRSSGDPEALLEGALEGAIADGDGEAVSDVIDALDRVADFEGEGRLRRRAESWRRAHEKDTDE